MVRNIKSLLIYAPNCLCADRFRVPHGTKHARATLDYNMMPVSFEVAVVVPLRTPTDPTIYISRAHFKRRQPLLSTAAQGYQPHHEGVIVKNWMNENGWK